MVGLGRKWEPSWEIMRYRRGHFYHVGTPLGLLTCWCISVKAQLEHRPPGKGVFAVCTHDRVPAAAVTGLSAVHTRQAFAWPTWPLVPEVLLSQSTPFPSGREGGDVVCFRRI